MSKKRIKIILIIAICTIVVAGSLFWCWKEYIYVSSIKTNEQAITIAQEHVLEKYGDQFADYKTLAQMIPVLGYGPWSDLWTVYFYKEEPTDEEKINSDIGAPIVIIKASGKARSTIRE